MTSYLNEEIGNNDNDDDENNDKREKISPRYKINLTTN